MNVWLRNFKASVEKQLLFFLLLKMPCLQLLLKVFISDPQAKCRGFFIPCGGFGGKLPKNRSWGVRVEPSGSSSARPGAQGEAEPQGYGRWEPAARALCCQKSPLGPRLGEGHLLQGILGISWEQRMESPEELHLGGTTKHLRAGENGVEQGWPVLGWKVWMELPTWVGEGEKDKAQQKEPREEHAVQTAKNGVWKETEPRQPEFSGPRTNLERQDFNWTQRKGSKTSNEMEGILLSRARNWARAPASAQLGRAQDAFTFSNSSKTNPKQTNKTTLHDVNILWNSRFGIHKSRSIKARPHALAPDGQCGFHAPPAPAAATEAARLPRWKRLHPLQKRSANLLESLENKPTPKIPPLSTIRNTTVTAEKNQVTNQGEDGWKWM